MQNHEPGIRSHKIWADGRSKNTPKYLTNHSANLPNLPNLPKYLKCLKKALIECPCSVVSSIACSWPLKLLFLTTAVITSRFHEFFRNHFPFHFNEISLIFVFTILTWLCWSCFYMDIYKKVSGYIVSCHDCLWVNKKRA